ncbi:MAG: succinate dehydrogenase, hydrophobic membrane anchor protein [Kistimonas sp.]|nr:succinate dehydrogenase, hydrophobic membrane anchor protein [Kistimonas sp.]
MVAPVTSLARSGLGDWVVQRLTAVLLAGYVLFMVAWLFAHAPLDYDQWRDLFAHTWMRVFSLLALLSLCAHAWIGLWTLSGDYLNERALGRKALLVRFLFQMFCGAALFGYGVWGIQILWEL